MIPTHAISLHAPWAWALMYGGKDVENRSLKFPRGVTGRVWIHASLWPGDIRKNRVREELSAEVDSVIRCMKASGEFLGRPSITDLLRDLQTFEAFRGHIVGSIEVTSYSETSDSAWYVPGSLAINVRDPQLLAAPVPAKGALGWWKVDRHPGLVELLKGAA